MTIDEIMIGLEFVFARDCSDKTKKIMQERIESYAKERVIEKLNIVREISTESEVIDWARNVIAELKGESR
jgi:hypothetical protein